MNTSTVHPQSLHLQELTPKEERQVVLASTLGTLFEWYDFFVFGALAVFMSAVIFPTDNPTAALMAALGALAVGFVIRPLGGLVFGYLGDKLGRKVTFLLTVVMMGGSTFLMGCLPSYETAGHLSWILLLALRIIQGLAVGGEYGGAVVYLAEHCNPKRRGLLTGWLQVTCIGGLLMCLVMVIGTQAAMTPEAFKAWGWRVPFLASVLLLGVSIYIRAKLHESPVFLRMKRQGTLVKNPIKEAFTKWSSLKWVLLALFTLNASTAASFYAGQFYVMIFLQNAVGLDQAFVYKLILIGCLIGAPAYVFFGWLSDRIGRKWIMIAGMCLTAICIRPLFGELQQAGNPKLTSAISSSPVIVHSQTAGDACDFSLTAAMLSSHADNKKPCVQAKKYLVAKGIDFKYAPALPGQVIAISVGSAVVEGFDAKSYGAALEAAGYPAKAEISEVNSARIVIVLIMLSVISAMIYGPVAAYLVELFPANIRYTALSMPYHIGAGIGGALPFVATYLSLSEGNVLAGLWYPIMVTIVGATLGSILLPNRKQLAKNEEFAAPAA